MAPIKIKTNTNELLKFIDSKLDEIADEIFADSQTNIIDKEIVDEGTLLKSGNINRQFLEKEIIYSANYADVIEFGRLPGSMPPVEALKGWVRRKGFAKDDKEVSKIAWAIATDIKKKGLMPRPFLSPAVESAKARLRSKQ